MKWQEKLGDYLIDISKYCFTGVIISSLVNDYAHFNEAFYPASALAVITLLALGLFISTKYNKEYDNNTSNVNDGHGRHNSHNHQRAGEKQQPQGTQVPPTHRHAVKRKKKQSK